MELSRPDINESDIEAVVSVMRSGWIVGGPQQEALEAGLAAYLGYEHAVGCSSWTTGAFLALHLLELGPDDEVIVPSYSFIATANVVRHVGARVVFADVEPLTWNLDVADVERRITDRTRAIITVDQLGMPVAPAVEELARSRGLVAVRDMACSIGTIRDGQPIGGGSYAAVTSFHARKIITSGEGGMIFTDDATAAARLRRLRHQGMSLSDFERHSTPGVVNESYTEVGFNFRLTDIQAAMLVSQFQRLDRTLAQRRSVAAAYGVALADLPIATPYVPEGVEPNWQSYMITVPGLLDLTHRDRLLNALREQGIPAKRGVMAAHLEGAYADLEPLSLPTTERALSTNVMLPMHPGITMSDVEQVANALDHAIRSVGAL